MTKNFSYLAFLCGICMLLIIGGVQLTNLPVYFQVVMIFVGLVGGIICFITLIRLLIIHNQEQQTPAITAEPTRAPEQKNKKRRPQSRL